MKQNNWTTSCTQNEAERARETLIWLESVTEKETGNAQPGACVDVLPRCWWRHHISWSGCGPDCRSNGGKKFSTKDKMAKKYSTASIEVCDIKIYHWLKYSNKTFLSRSATKCQQFRLVTHSRPLQAPPNKIIKKRFSHASDKLTKEKGFLQVEVLSHPE